ASSTTTDLDACSGEKSSSLPDSRVTSGPPLRWREQGFVVNPTSLCPTRAAGDIMWKRVLLIILSLLATLAAASRADDELFSKVRLNSTSASSGRTLDTPPQPRTLSNAAAVQTLLLAAGYTARIDERDSLRIEISRGEWTAPVLIGLADAGRQLRMAMRLTEPEENTVIAPRTLRGMLQANRSNWGAFFAIAGD